LRRKSADVFAPVRRAHLDVAITGLDPEIIIEILGPMVTPARWARMEAIFAARIESATVLMDTPYDPHNGAAVLRTLDAMGIDSLHVVERGRTFLAAAAVSRGSEKWVNVHTYPEPGPVLDKLRRDGFVLVGTHPEGELVPDDLAAIPRLCLVLGNEREGIGPELQQACDRRVRVPMRGFAESLNVGVTAAICLFIATKGRAGDLSLPARRALLARGMLSTVERAEEILAQRGLIPEPPPRPVRPHPTGKGRKNK
jgi:tRNA (guanosine-2'-O-)-methyltransferase